MRPTDANLAPGDSAQLSPGVFYEVVIELLDRVGKMAMDIKAATSAVRESKNAMGRAQASTNRLKIAIQDLNSTLMKVDALTAEINAARAELQGEVEPPKGVVHVQNALTGVAVPVAGETPVNMPNAMADTPPPPSAGNTSLLPPAARA
jgi:hypothetical protein